MNLNLTVTRRLPILTALGRHLVLASSILPAKPPPFLQTPLLFAARFVWPAKSRTSADVSWLYSAHTLHGAVYNHQEK